MEIAFKEKNSLSSFFFSSGGHFVHRSGTVLDILVQGHLSNIPVEFESNWPRGIGGVGI